MIKNRAVLLGNNSGQIKKAPLVAHFSRVTVSSGEFSKFPLQFLLGGSSINAREHQLIMNVCVQPATLKEIKFGMASVGEPTSTRDKRTNAFVQIQGIGFF
ncbi:MAG: hypothetical protein ACOC6B_02485 [Thermodesulfobacteriota bacterium]